MARNYVAKFVFKVADEASEKVKKIQESFKKFRHSMDEIQKSMQLSSDMFQVSDRMLVASGKIFSAIKNPIDAAANLEQQMSRVASKSGATAGELKKLKDVAVQLGASTVYTAVEVGQAEEELVKLGFTASQAAEAVGGVLSAAAAEGMSIADASRIVGAALNSFSLEMSQSSYVADILAKAASTSSTDILSLGESFKYIGPVAKGLGVPITEVVASLEGLSDFGIIGSKAGNSLQNFYTILAKFKTISRDSKGNLLPLDEALGNLEKRLSGLSETDKVTALKNSKLFGDIAGDAAIALLASRKTGQLTQRIDALKNSLGASAEMARVANDNFKGALEQMSGAMDSLKIAIGDPLLAPLKKVVGGISDVIASFAEWAKVHPGTVRALNIVLGAVGALTFGLGALTFALAAFIAVAAAPAALSALYALAKSMLAISGASLAPVAAFAEFALIAAVVLATLYSIYKMLTAFGLIEPFQFITDIEDYFSNDFKGVGFKNSSGVGISSTMMNPIYGQDKRTLYNSESLQLFKNRPLITDAKQEKQTGFIKLQIESDKKIKTKNISSKNMSLQVESGLMMGGL